MKILSLLTVIATLPVLRAADTLPKFYGMTDPDLSEAFRIEQQADLRGSFTTRGKFDIGIGEVRGNVRHVVTFTAEELAHFWKTQAAGKFVCLTLEKNTLTDEERRVLIERVAEQLFACGVRRVRLHQGYAAGVEVLYDEERVVKKDK